MHCQHCGREAPAGRYCGYCGAQAALSPRHDPRRRQAFAAHPQEHVYHPAIVTTFFPALAVKRTQQTRWLLLGGVVLIFLVGLGRYVPLAFVGAALFAPLLYLFYFYDVQIYEDEPFRVLASTFLLSGVLGALLSLGLYRALLAVEYTLPWEGPSPGYLILAGVIIPELSLALSLVGPLILYFARRRFDEVLDGLAFGVASGLGFAAAQSIVFTWQQISGPFQQTGDPSSWALPTIKMAILVPLLVASATGLVCASLWLARDSHLARKPLGLLASPLVAMLIAAVALMVPALGTALWSTPLTSLIWYGVTLAIMILVMRHVLHAGLVEKARELGHGGTLTCPNCHHVAPDVPFCPSCGLALRSVGKRARHTARVEEHAGE